MITIGLVYILFIAGSHKHLDIDLFTSSKDNMPKIEKVITNINEEIEIGEGSTSILVAETDSGQILSAATKEKSPLNVRSYSKSKTGNKFIPIKNQGNYFVIMSKYYLEIFIIMNILKN